ncbi:MAG: hypothetical protein UW69_C0065G0006 [Microgenomates group bacterium GW2011_GWA2_44_7]|nr:MAG: hypothetical protein UW69_C0065G0006 [Microgenomates group bacterium GW2011_GWA2_44_7]KKT77880.1 MAG: hypothetical protein UW73_C0010G0025 [Microgenomates group bacterium GW2011_GWB1_44_8]
MPSITKLKIDSPGKLFIIGFRLIIIFWGVYLLLATVARYNNFISESVDVAYYHSTVWQLSEFRVPRIWDTPDRFVWGDHFEPILLFFIPFYWIIKDATILIFLQAFLTISGMIPVFLLVKRKFKSETLALTVSLAYSVFGGLQMGYAYGFHPIVLFPAIFLWAYYFVETSQNRWYFLFLALSLMVKEEISFVIAAFGIYLLFKRKKLVGLTTLLAGISWYWFTFNLIFPFFNPGGFGHWGQYGDLASDGLVSLVQNFINNPLLLIQTLVTPAYKVETFFITFGSFAFLPLFYPPTWIMVAPPLFEKLLSSNIAALNGFHYSAVIWVIVTVSSIEALDYWLKKILSLKRIKSQSMLTIFILSFAILMNVYKGYRPYSLTNLNLNFLARASHVDIVYKIISSLPVNASISASYQIAPHINRPLGLIHPLPNMPDQPLENSDYVLIDFNLPLVLNTQEQLVTYLRRIEESGQYELITNQEKVVLLGRKGRSD